MSGEVREGREEGGGEDDVIFSCNAALLIPKKSRSELLSKFVLVMPRCSPHYVHMFLLVHSRAVRSDSPVAVIAQFLATGGSVETMRVPTT